MCQFTSNITTSEKKKILSRLGRCNSCHHAIWKDEGCFNEYCSNGKINILQRKREEIDNRYKDTTKKKKKLSEVYSYIHISQNTKDVLEGNEHCRVCGGSVRRKGNRTCGAVCALVEQSEYFEGGKSYFALSREDAEKRVAYYQRNGKKK